jgi:hypothetical protein
MTSILEKTATYNDIYKLLVDTNNEKINKLKTNMNNYIDSLNYKNTYNILPKYGDYILYLLTKSFPVLNKYHKQIIQILLLIDSINIHPGIYQTLLVNILFSVFVCELSINPEYKKNQEFIDMVANVYNEIEIIMSMFNEIFIKIDIEYKDRESVLLYEIINSLSHSEFENLSETISDDTELDDKIIKLNVLIIQIEKLTQNNMNEFFIQIDSNYDCSNKLEYDLSIYDMIIKEYNENIVKNYKYMIKFITYKNVEEIDILQFTNKNIVYYWIDYIAHINGKILDNLLK